jgi:hypothetical protein
MITTLTLLLGGVDPALCSLGEFDSFSLSDRCPRPTVAWALGLAALVRFGDLQSLGPPMP